MNWLGLAAIGMGMLAYFLGAWIARRQIHPTLSLLATGTMVFLAVPAMLYAIYYLRILGEPIWLYRWRTLTGSELMASPAGFLAGWMQVRLVPHLELSRVGALGLTPVALLIVLALPYLKPIFRPLRIDQLQDRWEDGVCLQSSPSTCGPASAATLLRAFGREASERELARAAFTSASGTENWYLARALRRRGLSTEFHLDKSLNVPLPAMAGVRLTAMSGAGHFIVLLAHEDEMLIVADPMQGRFTNTLAGLSNQYEFTGFLLEASPSSGARH